MKRTAILVSLIFTIVSLLFFYPSIKGKIPFPGDLLVGYYGPYNTNSYFGYGPGGVPNKAQGPDVVRQLFPWKYFTIESLKNGQIPFWNPYNLSGNPLMANFQSNALYPINLVFFIFNFLNAWTLFIFLIPLLSCFFTYVFLRELKVSNLASVFGAIVFAFSSYMVVWMEYGNVGHTFLWLPLALFFTEKLAQRFSIKNALFLIFTLVCSFLAGYIQGYFYIVFSVIFYFLLKTKYLKNLNFKKLLLFVFITLLCPLLLSSFQLLPTLELFSYSSRNNYTLTQIEKLLNPAWYAITVIVPNFFGHPASRNHWFYGTYIERVSYFGFIPFIFAIYAVLNQGRKKEIIIFTIIAATSLLLVTDLFVTRFLYLLPIPLLSTTVPTRILSLFTFSGSILAAFGFDLYILKTNKKLALIIGIISAILFTIWALVFGLLKFSTNKELLINISVTKNNLILPTIFLMVFAGLTYGMKKVGLKFVILAIFAFTIFDLFYFFHKITPFSPKEYVYPKTDVLVYIKNNASINRIWGYGSASLENNLVTYEEIFSAEGYEPLQSKRYGELISASKNGKITNSLSRSDANIAPGYGSSDLKENRYRQRFLNLLGVKYVLNKVDSPISAEKADNQTFDNSIYKLIWQKSPWQIYENMNVLPRVFLAGGFVVESDKDKIVQMIFDDKLDIRDKIILEEDIFPRTEFSKDKNAEIKIETYKPNKIVLRTKTSENMLLFLSDNYYPGWKVSVDGKNGKIYRADYSFRAVPIVKGEHEVIFSYYPESFDLGSKISLITLSLTMLFILIAKLKKG